MSIVFELLIFIFAAVYSPSVFCAVSGGLGQTVYHVAFRVFDPAFFRKIERFSDTASYMVAFSLQELQPTSGARAMSKLVEFLKNDSGATAIEYGLIAAGISIAIIAAVNTIGTTLNTKFTNVSTQLK